MRFFAIYLIFLLSCFNVGAQQIKVVKLYFDYDNDTLDTSKTQNAEALRQIKELTSDSTIEHIDIESSTSPEGGVTYNTSLANRRLEHTLKLLHNPNIADSLIHTHTDGIAWEQLRTLVDNSTMPYRSEVLRIIDSCQVETWSKQKPSDKWLTLTDSRNKQLMELRGGEPYRDMNLRFFPQLRKSEISITYYSERISEQRTPIIVKEHFIEPLYYIIPIPDYYIVKPLFAIKTNLLFDALTLINVEVEVPIRQRWSVAVEYIFPWWIWDNKKLDSKRNRIELLNTVIEGKYWWGNRAQKNILTGWYTGLYGGGGVYDFEHNAKGYQGEFMLDVGISGGYAHTINHAKTLRMEYSLGLGYLQTKYRYYEASCYCNGKWHPEKLRSGVLKWIGPTRAKVSLSWLINCKKRINL